MTNSTVRVAANRVSGPRRWWLRVGEVIQARSGGERGYSVYTIPRYCTPERTLNPQTATMRQSILGLIFGLSAAAGQAQQPEGVYTVDQAARGQAVYTRRCSQCHGADLSGAGERGTHERHRARTWGRPGLTL